MSSNSCYIMFVNKVSQNTGVSLQFNKRLMKELKKKKSTYVCCLMSINLSLRYGGQ